MTPLLGSSLVEPEAQVATLDELVFGRADLWPLLLLVPLCVAAFVWAARARKHGLRSLGNPALVQRLVASVDRGARVIEAVLITLAVALLSTALMRLQYGGTAKVVPASGLDVVIAVDYSKSMLAKDVYPSRSARLEAELGRFLDEADRRGDRVGLVLFAGEARGLPVSRDTRLLKLYLDRADPRTENPGGTAIGKALRLSLAFLVDARQREETEDGAPGEIPVEADAEQAVILLTDGEDNSSRPLELLEEAAKLGVRLYTVGIGSRSGEPVQRFDAQGEPDGFVTDEDGNYVMTRLDEDLLRKLADGSRGKYIHVDPDTFGLDAVRAELASLSGAARQDTVEIHRDEGFMFLVLPALVLLSLALGLGDRRRRSP